MTDPVEGQINRPKMIKRQMFVTVVSRPARCPSYRRTEVLICG
jgi:hypothetical protein